MPTYHVLPCDLTCYKGYQPPNIKGVFVYAECFPPDMCRVLCDRVDAGHIYDSSVHDPVLGQKVETYHRSSQGVTIDQPTYAWAQQRINAVVQYHLAQRIVEPFKNLRICEPTQFLRYDEQRRGRFRRHWDDAYHDAQGKFHFTSPQRKFVSVLYLNDDYEGGMFVWDTIRDEHDNPLRIKPATGSILVMPCDQRFPHEVEPVTKGIRRSVVTWFDVDHQY